MVDKIKEIPEGRIGLDVLHSGNVVFELAYEKNGKEYVSEKVMVRKEAIYCLIDFLKNELKRTVVISKTRGRLE